MVHSYEREVTPMTTETLTRAKRAYTLPIDPFLRSEFLRTRIGTHVMLFSGDFTVTGMLVAVLDPAKHADRPVPVVIIDTGLERIAGPVIDGDRLI